MLGIHQKALSENKATGNNAKSYLPAVNNDGLCKTALLQIKALHSDHKLNKIFNWIWNAAGKENIEKMKENSNVLSLSQLRL